MLDVVAGPSRLSERLRAPVMADPDLQRGLAGCREVAAFSACLRKAARDRGIEVAPDELAAALRPDPLDTARYRPYPPDGSTWPHGPWLPVHVGMVAGDAVIDWLYFGDKRLVEPFFFDTARQVQQLPFNRMFRYRLRLHDFLAMAETNPPPDGFIFHMSRCGSTLAAQMIAALPDSVVVSEAPPLDQLLQICLGASEDTAVKALRAIVAAFGRRTHGERRYVLKLDAWHVLALPLFRRAFPDVPWVFLYRDPVEVLVSQVRQRGMQMVPELVAPGLFGLETGIPDEDYCARVLRAMCRAAIEHYGLGGGLVLNYARLPDAVEQTILPHFGLGIGAAERSAMREAARRDAKQPYQNFTPDSDGKQREANDRLRALAKYHLSDVYDALEKLQHRQR